jgi:hypothetical protein
MTIVDTIADAHYGDKVTLAMAFAHPVADGRHHTRRLISGDADQPPQLRALSESPLIRTGGKSCS